VSTLLDDWLLQILVCPEDKGPLWYVPAEDLLYNPRLRRRYPIRDGIPTLLVEEAESATDADHERLVALQARGEGVTVTGGGGAVEGGGAADGSSPHEPGDPGAAAEPAPPGETAGPTAAG
jgi:uncharacterized protein YbaR (Trm112 family)